MLSGCLSQGACYLPVLSSDLTYNTPLCLLVWLVQYADDCRTDFLAPALRLHVDPTDQPTWTGAQSHLDVVRLRLPNTVAIYMALVQQAAEMMQTEAHHRSDKLTAGRCLILSSSG
jgi:hypothetical protein